MSAVYTRTGDGGSTGLFGGSRVPKDDIAVESYGTVDEAESAIGVARALLAPSRPDIAETLHHIQQRLFMVAAELASDEAGRAKLAARIGDEDVADLERVIDDAVALTGAPSAFVVPGFDPASAALHQARTIVRRAERQVLRMGHERSVSPDLVRYLNRLSDALYALARVVEEQVDEVEPTTWDRAKRTKHEKPNRAIDPALVEQVVRAVVASMRSNSSLPLDLTTAKALAEAAEKTATEMSVPIVFAVVDGGGTPLLLHRMDGSLLASVDLAVNKAFTSVAMRQPTEQLRLSASTSGPLYGIETSNAGRIVLFGGGIPVFDGDRLLGGLGVSGGSVEEDIAIVTAAYRSVFRPSAAPVHHPDKEN
jgi:ATP:cob(I)alamin adenosyltransferase